VFYDRNRDISRESLFFTFILVDLRLACELYLSDSLCLQKIFGFISSS
jgi:hypothetical protein